MKTFLFSAVTFFLLIGAIVGNCIWVNHVTTHLADALQELSEAPTTAAVREVIDYWQKRETALGVSIPANELEDVSEHMVALDTNILLGDKEDFERSRALCLESVLRIQRLERFSLLYIL